MKRVLLAVVLLLGVSACGNSDVTMGGEFTTMKQCISTIEAKVGPLKMSVDTPTEIIGTTSTGRLFSCKRAETAAPGTSYRGWYLVAG